MLANFVMSGLAVFEDVLIPWRGVLKEGTPIDRNGYEANGEDAYGIIVSDVTDAYLERDGRYYAKGKAIVAGYVNLDVAEKCYGEAYESACKSAMRRIVFVKEKLTAENVGASVLPTVTAEDNGDVLKVVEGAWAKSVPQQMENIEDLTDAPTAADFNGLLAKLVSAGFMKEAEEESTEE